MSADSMRNDSYYHHNGSLHRKARAQGNRISVHFLFLRWDLICRTCFHVGHSYGSLRFEPYMR